MCPRQQIFLHIFGGQSHRGSLLVPSKLLHTHALFIMSFRGLACVKGRRRVSTGGPTGSAVQGDHLEGSLKIQTGENCLLELILPTHLGN